MKLSPKAKKWGKRILILVLIRFVIGAVLYYIITYRFKEVIQVVVKKESHGAYGFEASDVSMNIWKKRLVLHDAQLICKDSMAASAHYAVHIPEVYLKIDSWTDLIFHKKVSIDSIAIIQPNVFTHQHEQREKKQVAFHTANILSGLQKALKHLQVRSFSLQGGSFTYGTRFSNKQLTTDNINFGISNFSKQNDTTTHLLAADDIQLDLANQHWTLPSGNAEINFKKLHFSGRTETFQLDSFYFRSLDSTKPKISISAEKLFFNSKQLSDIYEKDELVLDTLLLVNPVVHLHHRDRHQLQDSSHVSRAFENMLGGIHFRYVNIVEGQLAFYKGSEKIPTYASEKTNLEIFNLGLSPRTATLSTDSIHLRLRNLSMLTKDSLFEMKVADFNFHGNELAFKNVSYGPSKFNHSPEGITFETPLLQIKEVDIENLLHKRLKGTEAILHRPSITVYKNKKAAHTGKSKDHFYETLHGVGELIDVDDFHVMNGNLQMQSHGQSDMKMAMKNINAKILLNRFLSSDSLIDIKRAMPDLRIGEMKLASFKLQLDIQNYHFEGGVRHNAADNFHLSLSNGTDIAGKNLYWWIFDWDMFKNHGIILVEHIDVRELDMNLAKKTDTAHESKELPVLFIRRVDVGRLGFKQEGLQFTANNICADQVTSEKHGLKWQNAAAQVRDMVFRKNNVTASVEQVQFTNEYESVLKNVTVETNKATLQLPLVKLRAPLHSTGMSSFDLESLEINKGKMNFKSDSIALLTTFNLKGKSLRTSKTETPLQFDSLYVGLTDFVIRKKGIAIGARNMDWTFSNGTLGKHALITNISGSWTNVEASVKMRNNAQLEVKNVSGNFNKNNFVLAKKMQWKELMKHTAIIDAAVYFNTSSVIANSESLSWDPVNSQLNARSFSITPRASLDSMLATSQWQSDYITVSGNQLSIAGISYDSILTVRQVMADGISLTTTRDKRKPFKGLPKKMPAQLLRTVKFPFQVDSVLISNSTVNVREISAATQKTGVIPLQNLHATITGISSIDGTDDSLSLSAKFVLLNNNFRHFYYNEAYDDSLSGFRAGVHAAPMPLEPYSSITIPLASVTVAAGTADTLYASWTGNTHGAFGTMNFHYEGLKVKLLDKKDPSKKNLLLSVENWLANTVVKNNNKKDSRIFFMRDKQKFVFNYWIKTIMHGMMSSVGIKRNRKYVKQYRKAQDIYDLPEE